MSLLDKIKSSSDIKQLDEQELPRLAEEIRQEIIQVVSTNGGHLASNLGVVELTMALHYCFDIGRDQVVWDVGHQSYVHKILTGRRDKLHTIRTHGGLSGFPKRSESPTDPFGAGHASTAISAALGLATARDFKGEDNKVIAVVGDGALTGGLAFEGLNNVGELKKDVLVVLNDNKMSISKNVGALSKYLTNILTDKRFNKLRDEIWDLTGRFKRRDKIRSMVSDIEKSIKGLFVPGYFFERLGFRYLGPIDGHDLPLLIKTLRQIKDISAPKLLHIVTVKGKGFAPAEADATRFHGIGSFDKVTGRSNSTSSRPTYTQVFGDAITELAENNDKIVAITAAMCSGTGLTKFSERFPERFYDVGIAEGHAVCFAAGLAAGGYRPFVAIYSTFLQRAYDQIIHDVALQKLPVVFCVDRAGLVGEDGPTHHGAFDLSYLSVVPNLTIMSPADGDELRSMLSLASTAETDGPIAIRFPRASVPYEMNDQIETIQWGIWPKLKSGADVAIIATGSMVDTALKCRELLKAEKNLTIINARFIKPLDEKMLDSCLKHFEHIVCIEENSTTGGLGSAIGNYLMKHNYHGIFKSFAIPDKFITHGGRAILMKEIGLDTESIAKYLRNHHEARRTLLQKLTFRKSEPKKPTVVMEVHNENLAGE